jgi:hypothetical protein
VSGSSGRGRLISPTFWDNRLLQPSLSPKAKNNFYVNTIAISAARQGRKGAGWSLAERPPGEPYPTKFWFSSMPEQTSLGELVPLAKIRWRIVRDF